MNVEASSVMNSQESYSASCESHNSFSSRTLVRAGGGGGATPSAPCSPDTSQPLRLGHAQVPGREVPFLPLETVIRPTLQGLDL